jgi:hypothetical protein
MDKMHWSEAMAKEMASEFGLSMRDARVAVFANMAQRVRTMGFISVDEANKQLDGLGLVLRSK